MSVQKSSSIKLDEINAKMRRCYRDTRHKDTSVFKIENDFLL